MQVGTQRPKNNLTYSNNFIGKNRNQKKTQRRFCKVQAVHTQYAVQAARAVQEHKRRFGRNRELQEQHKQEHNARQHNVEQEQQRDFQCRTQMKCALPQR